jgi:CBS domain-containing protein
MADFSRATRIAGALGRGFGHAMIALGLLMFLVGAPGGLWFAFIGWFLAASAAAEARLAEARSMLEGLTVLDAMVPDPDTAEADASLEAFMNEVFAGSRHTAYPVIDGDEVVGMVMFRSVAAVPRTEWAGRRVRDAMVPLSETLVLAPDEPLFDAAVELMQIAAARGVVIDGGRLAGLLTLSDLSRLLELRRLTERSRPRRPVPA